MSGPQLGQPSLHNISGVARLHHPAGEQVRVVSIAPPVDCGEVEIAGRRIGLWKSARQQIGQHRLEFGARLAEAAGGHLQRDIARLDVEAHGYVYREFGLSVIAASAPRTDIAPDSTCSIRSTRPSRRRRAST